MSPLQITAESLEARDVLSDKSTMAQRMEAFRDIMPAAAPHLLVNPGDAGAEKHSDCIPEVSNDQLSVDILRTALAEHGALIVRGMFSAAETDALTHVIDRVFETASAPMKVRAELVSPYFSPPHNLKTIMPNKQQELTRLRLFNAACGGIMAVEAPSVAEALLQLYEQHGIKELVGAYLGEPPCLSAKKWVLRRSKLPVNAGGWHQDGAFMGTDINSLNLWIPLTECGGETGAPGMDVVPKRLYDIATAEGAAFDWSVSDEHIQGGAFEARSVAPVFHAGDAFFFDHLYLHRTQSRTDFTRVRYAIETWFFGETTFPKDQVPILWRSPPPAPAPQRWWHAVTPKFLRGRSRL